MGRNRWWISLLIFSASLFAFSPKRIGGDVVSGILSADFRETPISELLPLENAILPPVRMNLCGDRPRLLFHRKDAAFFRRRMNLPPYREWAEYILSSARQGSDPTSPFLSERERSGIAKRNAFAWFLTGDTHYLRTALQAMRHMADPEPIRDLEGGTPGQGWGDFLETAEALRHYTVAWDLLVDRIPTEERHAIATRLSFQAERLFRHRFLVPKNNHAIVVGVGLGTAALGLDHPRASDWLEAALGEIRAGLSLIEPDGTYREGAYYGRFIASHLAPFSYYLFKQTEINLLLVPRLRLFFRWLDDLTLPDGSIPDFDDAFPEAFLYEPIIAGLLPEIRVDPTKSTARCPKDDPHWIEAYCAFQGNRTKSPGERASVIYPYSGMAIFREGDLYALFLGEPGRPHLSGHDHVEPGALTLWAFGVPLLIDAGYGPKGVEDPDRAWYTSAQAHNLPLVDGLGPDQNPVWGDALGARFSDHWVTPPVSSASTRMHFRDAHFLRRVWFIGGRFFVVSDRMASHRARHFSVAWHGAGRLEDLGGHRIRWVSEKRGIQGEPFLDAWFLTPTSFPLSLESRTGLHTHPTPGLEHTAVRVNLPPNREATLTTLLIPGRHPDRIAEVTDVPLLSEGEASARRIRYPDSETYWIITAEAPWHCGPLESDASLVIYREPGTSGVETFLIEEATHLRLAGEALFSSSLPVTMTLIRDDLSVYGHLTIPEGVSPQLALRLHADPGVIFIDRKSTSYHWSPPWITFEISQGGLFEIGPLRNRIRETETVHENLPLLRRLSESKKPNPAGDLTPSERIVLQNEIVSLLGQKSLEAADATIKGIGLTGTYGLVSGLLTALFGQSGRLKGGLPQKLNWNGAISGHDLRYRQEGFISSRGWRLHRQTLILNDQVWLTQERPFSGCVSTGASVYTENLIGNIRHETSPLGEHREIFLRKKTQEGWMAAAWRSGIARGHSGLVGLAHGPWQEELLFVFPKKKDFSWQARLRHQTKREASQGRVWGRGNTWEGLGIKHGRCFSDHWEGFGGWEMRRDPLGSLYHITSLQSHHAWGPIGARLLAEKEGEHPLRTGWLGRISLRAWRIDTHGELTPRCVGDVGVVYQKRGGSFRLYSHRSKRWETAATLPPQGEWIPMFHATWNRKGHKPESLGFAFFHPGTEAYGGELRILRNEGISRIAWTGIASLPLRPHEWLFVYTSLSAWVNGKDPLVELHLRQEGSFTTPGLYLLIDEKRCIRFEGFLSWRF